MKKSFLAMMFVLSCSFNCKVQAVPNRDSDDDYPAVIKHMKYLLKPEIIAPTLFNGAVLYYQQKNPGSEWFSNSRGRTVKSMLCGLVLGACVGYLGEMINDAPIKRGELSPLPACTLYAFLYLPVAVTSLRWAKMGVSKVFRQIVKEPK